MRKTKTDLSHGGSFLSSDFEHLEGQNRHFSLINGGVLGLKGAIIDTFCTIFEQFFSGLKMGKI